MGFLDKITGMFGKKSSQVAGPVNTAVDTMNQAVDQLQSTVPGTAGDAMIDKGQETVSTATQQFTAPTETPVATPQQPAAPAPSSDGVVPAPVQQPETAEQPNQQPPQNPVV